MDAMNVVKFCNSSYGHGYPHARLNDPRRFGETPAVPKMREHQQQFVHLWQRSGRRINGDRLDQPTRFAAYRCFGRKRKHRLKNAICRCW